MCGYGFVLTLAATQISAKFLENSVQGAQVGRATCTVRPRESLHGSTPTLVAEAAEFKALMAHVVFTNLVLQEERKRQKLANQCSNLESYGHDDWRIPSGRLR